MNNVCGMPLPISAVLISLLSFESSRAYVSYYL